MRVWIIAFIWLFWGKQAKKRLKTMNVENSFDINYCIKCGERADMSGKKFLETRYTHETITRKGNPPSAPIYETGLYQMGAYRPEGEIVSVNSTVKSGGDGKAYTEYTAQIKFTHHVHEVTRDCSRCGHRWVSEEDLPNVENPQTVIFAQNVTVEAEKTIEFIYCKFCGTKHRADETKCSGCGSSL